MNSKALRPGWCILAIIVFGFVLTIRIRLLGIPLEIVEPMGQLDFHGLDAGQAIRIEGPRKRGRRGAAGHHEDAVMAVGGLAFHALDGPA